MDDAHDTQPEDSAPCQRRSAISMPNGRGPGFEEDVRLLRKAVFSEERVLPGIKTMAAIVYATCPSGAIRISAVLLAGAISLRRTNYSGAISLMSSNESRQIARNAILPSGCDDGCVSPITHHGSPISAAVRIALVVLFGNLMAADVITTSRNERLKKPLRSAVPATEWASEKLVSQTRDGATSERSRGTIACLVIERRPLIGGVIAGFVQAFAGIGNVCLATSVAECGVADAGQLFDLVIWLSSIGNLESSHLEEIVGALRSSQPAAAIIVLAPAAEASAPPAECWDSDVTILSQEATAESLWRSVDQAVHKRVGTRPAPDPAAVLRPRELEVFALLGEGMSTKRIASTLGITTFTVNAHRRAIVARLGIVGAELIRAAALHSYLGRAAR